MPKITAISPQKRKGRFNVYIDGEFAFGIDEDTLIVESLTIGKEISELEIAELEEKSEEGKLYQKTLGFLEYRPRSEKEVKNYLNKKFATTETLKGTNNVEVITEHILKRLKSHNYLNDLEFAKWWVEQRRSGRNPKGIRAVRSELYQKGISRKIVEKVISAEGTEDNTEVQLAMQAAQKKLKLPESPNHDWELKRKLGAYLARRGFDWETIKTVVDKLFVRG